MIAKSLRAPSLWVMPWVCLLPGGPLMATPEKPNFQDDVLPLFEQSCNSCHNPDNAKGGLDLTSMSALLAGGSSGDAVVPGDGPNSYLYKLVARIEKPYMPREKEKLPQAEIDLIRKWIDLGLLPTATGKPIQKKKSSLNLALGTVSTGKPDGPPPMPEQLALEPSVVTARPAAISAMAVNPWSPLVALSGQKQVTLYHTDSREILGVLPYPEGFVESLVFSRNGLLLMAGGGRGGKSGRIAAWEVKTGRRVLTLGEEYDTILASDLSSDQTLVALGGPAKRIKVYDLATGEILHNVKKHSEWVTAVAFSPDGVLLATGDRNGGLHVWEARSGNLFYTLDGHKQAITSLSWRTDSNLLASASEEGSIRTWEMFNGKQVRTWTAHGGGALSVDLDKKGNFVTAGRDKTVKIWNPDGGVTRTLSGFPEMTLEARFSHDGSQVIVGDWTGAVSIWKVSDGKKEGDLLANPPSLTTRLNQASEQVVQREKANSAAKAKHASFVKALAAANEKLVEAKAVASAAETARKAAEATLANAKKALEAATLARNQSAQKKATLEGKRNEEKKKLDDARKGQTSNKTQADNWSNRSSFRSNQISMLRETHRKARQAHDALPEDSSLKEAVGKQLEALTAMEKALTQARGKTAAHLAKAEEFAKLEMKYATALQAAEKALANAEKLLAQSETARLEKESAMKVAETDRATKVGAHEKALAEQEKRTQEQAAATAAEKGPAQELAATQASLVVARNSVSRWKAEQINVMRHVELGKLHELQKEFNGLANLASEAKKVHDRALAALEAARKALEEVPAKIKASEEALAQRQDTVGTETKKLELSHSKAKEKQGFLDQVQNIATATKAKAAGDAQNAELAAATKKLAESLELLKKDLGNAQAGIVSQKENLQTALSDVQQAQANLEQTKQFTTSAPKLVQEKETVTQETKTKVDEKNKARDEFKTKVDAQGNKAEALRKQYLDTLPD